VLLQKQYHNGDFLPDLCHVRAVLTLVIAAELLAICITLLQSSVEAFDWLTLGQNSILLLWIILTSAAALCPLRPWFAKQSSLLAGTASYALVVSIACVFIVVGQYMVQSHLLFDVYAILDHTLIAAILAGVILRYFYIQQQLRNQQQAQLVSNFQALQARIRPHFLFNSMNTIASLIPIDPVTAEKMIVVLSQLLRSSLNDKNLVKLNDEMALCKGYIDMEQLRLGDRLHVNWQLDNIPDHQLAPSLLLQPILENAIYHGIQPRIEGGIITVGLMQSKKRIAIKIQNPVNPHAKKQPGNGLALDNIRHRLDALYGSEAKMRVTASATHYSVELFIPANQPEQPKPDELNPVT